MLKAEDFFDLSKFEHSKIFEGTEYVWDALKNLKSYIRENIEPNISRIRKNGDVLEKTYLIYKGEIIDGGFELEVGEATKGTFNAVMGGKKLEGAAVIYAGVALLDDNIYIGKGTVVEPGALIKGPTIVGENTDVRQGAYIRGDVLVGDKCVVGHTTEMKSSIMIYNSKAGHFAYIGDSILGQVNLGAGTKLANLKVFESEVILNINGKKYNTGLRKFGAVMGDDVETGCNTVTSPGTLMGKGVLSYPNTLLRGYYPANSIVKLRQNHDITQKDIK